MPSTLTNGYSLAAHIPLDFARHVFRPTFLRLLPEFERQVGGRSVHVWFGWPELRFVTNPSILVNLVEVTLPFTARLADRTDEARGVFTARPSLVQTVVGSGDDQLTAPMVDFRTNEPGSFDLEVDVEAYRDLVMTAMVASLGEISPFTAAPLFPDAGRQFFFRTYSDVDAGTQPGLLGVFISDDRAVPPALPTTLAASGAHHLTAVALVPRDRVDAQIRAGLVQQGLDALPAPLPGQDGLTLTALSIGWDTGFFLVTGGAEKEIGPITGSVTFRAWVQLAVAGDAVQVVVARTDQDGDWLLDIGDLFSGGAITRLLEELIPRAVSTIGSGAFGSLAVFAEAVPQEQAFATVRAFGQIGIRPTGLSVPVVPATEDTEVPPTVPYIRGNTDTREFHVAGCRYGDVLKAVRLRRFPTWQAAVAAGYNGCWTCQRAYDVVEFADVRVEVTGFGDGTPDPARPEVTATYTGSGQRFGVPLGPITETPRPRDGQFDDGLATYSTQLRNVVPGAWVVATTVGSAVVSAPVAVAREWTDGSGQRHGQRTVVEVTVASGEVRVTYE